MTDRNSVGSHAFLFGVSQKQKKGGKDDSDGINADIGEVSAPAGDEGLMKLI